MSNDLAVRLSAALKRASTVKAGLAVTRGGNLIMSQGSNAISVPFADFEVSMAFDVQRMIAALDGCKGAFSVTEASSSITVANGRRKAEVPAVSASVVPTPVMQPQVAPVDENFVSLIKSIIPLQKKSDAVVATGELFNLSPYAVSWTDQKIIVKVKTKTWFPDILVRVSDLENVIRYKNKIVGIGGDDVAVTFWYADGSCAQIGLVDKVSVAYPNVDKVLNHALDSISVGSEGFPLDQDLVDDLTYMNTLNEHVQKRTFYEDGVLRTARDSSDKSSATVERQFINCDSTRAIGFNAAHFVAAHDLGCNEIQTVNGKIYLLRSDDVTVISAGFLI